MGSKRSKKLKFDAELYMELGDNDDPQVKSKVNQPVEHKDASNTTVKGSKRKRKSESSEVSKKQKDQVKRAKIKKVKLGPLDVENSLLHKDQSEIQISNTSAVKNKEISNWTNEDILQLINNIEKHIPENDGLAYRSRVEKLKWDSVAFKSYSAAECKATWLGLQKRIRRFRLLSEILKDAKEWIMAPKKAKRHPDMPRRPLSSYLLFYLNKKDEILNANPGMDGSDITKIVGQIYKTLPPETREKYEKMAASYREEYEEKLKKFFKNHPELPHPQWLEKEKPVKIAPTEKPLKNDRKPGRPTKTEQNGDRPPKNCQTAFGLYYANELKNISPETDKNAFKEKCRQEYKNMPDKKKVYWINLAEQDLIRYQEEVRAYKAKHPNFKEHRIRPLITKRERASKERAAGKPVKPPNSAYALFSRVLLQSDEIKSIHPKDRMNYIANKWKSTTEEEQAKYKEQLMDNYKQEYEAYLESLPEEDRKTITQQLAKKRKRNSRVSKKVKKNVKRKSSQKSKPKKKFEEPEQPPISACKYFATLYKGNGDPVQEWKALSVEEKQQYEEDLVKKKQAYIAQFEKFLKSLSKEELEEFSRSRQQQSQANDEESSECSSGSEDDDQDEDSNKEQNEEHGNESSCNKNVQESDSD